MRAPLRLRIAIWTALLVGLVLAAVGVSVSMHLYNEGIAECDRALTRTARHFFRQVAKANAPIEWSDPARVEALLFHDGEPYLAEVKDSDGRVLHRSSSIDKAEYPPLIPNGPAVTGRNTHKAFRFAAFEDNGLVLTVAANAHMVFEAREDVLRSILGSSPLVLLLVGFVGWWVAGRALAPVRAAAAAAEAITAERLDQRLPAAYADDEIGRLTAVLNRMIDRLEASFHQARRFSADASHELRTPITVLRGEIEDALRAPDLPASHERFLLNLLEEVEGLWRITDGLLLLSRADAGRLQLDRKSVNFSAILCELVEDAEILAQANDVSVETQIADGVLVAGHEGFLRQLALNLIDNAVKYNRPAGRVLLKLSRAGDAVNFTVGNTGVRIAPDHAAHIFERFYRVPSSQHDGRHGQGLGLSICREIARAHAGEITLSRSEEDWNEFRVLLPGAPAAMLPKEPIQSAS